MNKIDLLLHKAKRITAMPKEQIHAITIGKTGERWKATLTISTTDSIKQGKAKDHTRLEELIAHSLPELDNEIRNVQDRYIIANIEGGNVPVLFDDIEASTEAAKQDFNCNAIPPLTYLF